VPDRATCHIDIRLTRTFNGDRAMAWLEAIVHAVDARARIENGRSLAGPISSRPITAWSRSFAVAAEARPFARPVPTDVCGPSNIGNLLAARGRADGLCRRASASANMHAADEWTDIDSIARSTPCIARGAGLPRA